jgi:hypothetical protein
MWATTLSATLLICLGASSARAEGTGDGVYERFDADLTLQFDVGVGILRSGESSPSLVAELRARVVDAAGLVVAFDAAPAGEDHLFVGLEIRPLWPALFLMNLSSGHERWDLLLESIGIEIGAGLTPLGDGLGVGLSWGVGVELPLILPETFAQGVWLRLGARHQDVRPSSAGAPKQGQDAWLAYVTLALRGGLDLGLSSWEPARYRMPERR